MVNAFASNLAAHRAALGKGNSRDLVTTGLLNPRKIALRSFDEACSPDADADGESDPVDRCPDTPRGESVDEGGCSLAQFCAGFDATTRDGARACKRADWQNDEPLVRLRHEADCVVDKGTQDDGDERCVPTP